MLDLLSVYLGAIKPPLPYTSQGLDLAGARASCLRRSPLCYGGEVSTATIGGSQPLLAKSLPLRCACGAYTAVVGVLVALSGGLSPSL